MMAPTALPTFATYDDIGNAAATQFGKLLGAILIASGLAIPLY